MKFTAYQALMLAALLLVGAAGCTPAPPPEFRLNAVQAAVNEISPEYQQEIANTLGAVFGTPDNPAVLPETGLNQKLLEQAAGAAYMDADDVTHGLYRRHCVHCHGISGDGRGPTAQFLNPYPRDYRKGVFKFKSTYAAAKPSDEDLVRILHNGIPGTSMPSFSLLPQPEVDALVEYVKYLSIRGELETALVTFVRDELGEEEAEDEDGNPIMNEDGTPKMVRPEFNPGKDADQAEVVKSELAMIVESWAAAKDQVVVPVGDDLPAQNRSPEEYAASVDAGRELFFGKDANCFTCHGPTALGDGQQTDFDDWTKDSAIEIDKKIETTKKSIESLAEAPDDETDEQAADREASIERNEALLATLEAARAELYPTRNAIPRNLRQGIYRGGRRRIDIFYRIHAGIKGVPMPGVGSTSPGGAGTLNEKQIWQIVDYVLSLPYEHASGPDQDQPINEAAVTR